MVRWKHVYGRRTEESETAAATRRPQRPHLKKLTKSPEARQIESENKLRDRMSLIENRRI